MSEIHFRVKALPGGGFLARAIGADIFTEADKISDLHDRVREAARCHFDEGTEPRLIRLTIESAGPDDDCRQIE